MTHYIKDKDGKFIGSIGQGINGPRMTPQRPIINVVESLEDSLITPAFSEDFFLDTSVWEFDPSATAREIYQALQPRITAVNNGGALSDEDSRYQWIMQKAAQSSVEAREQGQMNRVALWYYSMEYARFTQSTHTATHEKESLESICKELIERIIREEEIARLQKAGFDYPSAEGMEKTERRCGGYKMFPNVSL
jgi:hypothetical protein